MNIQMILYIAELFFVVYLIIYSTFLFASILLGTVELYNMHQMKQYRIDRLDEIDIPVSIVVPAHNESVTIVQTIRSLLALDYPVYEIIVVDDGSSDDTASKVIETFGLQEIEASQRDDLRSRPIRQSYSGHMDGVHILLLVKENGGKADSLNAGINCACFPYFLCMDADSLLQKDALMEIVKPVMEHENVVACGGLIRIVNGAVFQDGRVVKYRIPYRILVGTQMLEYDRSFLGSRLFLNRFNGNLIVSGAFGLFQKKAVLQVGGYSTDSLGEDMDLVMKLHTYFRLNRRPYTIEYVPKAVCWTQAPSSVKDIFVQRRRWHIGLMQCLNKYWRMFLSFDFGALGWLSYPYYLFYEYLSPFIELAGVVVTLLALWFRLINFSYMVTFFLVYFVFGVFMSVSAFLARVYSQNVLVTRRDIGRVCLMAVVEAFFTRFVVLAARISALFRLRRKKMEWGSITRTENPGPEKKQ